MSSRLPELDGGTIEALACALGECGTGSEIGRILSDLNISDRSGESTKWKRLDYIFKESQQRTKRSNQIFAFIKELLAPVRFAERTDEFEQHRSQINRILVMSGLEFGKDGEFRRVKVARTLDEAERRVAAIRKRFRGRRMHSEVDKYCKTELMQENYFHAVFEATKGLAERMREMSGVDGDGIQLVDNIFSVENPILAINSLETESEKSEHKGFAQLLKGCFAAIRNPLAHEPKILWTGEDDAADYLSLISLLHRKLDDAVPTKPNESARKL